MQKFNRGCVIKNNDILDALCDSDIDFVRYFRRHDCDEARKALLHTNRLRLLYCYHICRRRSIYRKIKSNGDMLLNKQFQEVRRSIRYNKPACITDILVMNTSKCLTHSCHLVKTVLD